MRHAQEGRRKYVEKEQNKWTSGALRVCKWSVEYEDVRQISERLMNIEDKEH